MVHRILCFATCHDLRWLVVLQRLVECFLKCSSDRILLVCVCAPLAANAGHARSGTTTGGNVDICFVMWLGALHCIFLRLALSYGVRSCECIALSYAFVFLRLRYLVVVCSLVCICVHCLPGEKDTKGKGKGKGSKWRKGGQGKEVALRCLSL